MAQYIPKFEQGAPGGIQQITLIEEKPQEEEAPKKRLIKRGADDIDLDHYIADLEYNFENWLESRDLSKKYKDLVRDAYRVMINGYNKGEMIPDLGNVTTDLTGKYTPKEKGFDEYKYAQNFFYKVLQTQRPYTKPEDKTTTAGAKKGNNYDMKKGLFPQFQSYLNTPDGANDYDYFNSIYEKNQDGSFSDKQKTGLIDFLQAQYNNLESGSLKYDNIDEENLKRLKNLIQGTIAELNTNGLTANAKLWLGYLGIDPSKLFSTTSTAPTDPVDPLEEQKKILVQQERQRHSDFLAYWNSFDSLDETAFSDLTANFPDEKTRYYNSSYYKTVSKFFSKPEIAAQWNNLLAKAAKWVQDEVKANDLKNTLSGNNPKTALFNSNDGFGHYLFGQNNALNAVIAIEMAAEYWKNNNTEENNNILHDGSIVIADNVNGKYVLTYDPRNRTIQKRSFKYLKEKDYLYLRKLLYVRKGFDIENYVPQNKEGGILKAQLGSIVTYSPQEIHQAFAEQEKQEHQTMLANLGMTEEQYQKQKQKEERENAKLFGNDAIEWTSADQARAVSIGSDIISMISSFVPGYGTAVSAATGVFGTGAQVYADIVDGESLGTVLGTLTLGLGLDLMGLIPGLGTAGKTGKIIKSAVKLAPKIMAIGTFLSPDVRSSVSKLLNDPNNITVKDWQNIAYATKAITGLAANAGTGLKRSAMRDIMGEPTKVTEGTVRVKIKGKKGKVSEETLSIGKGLTEEEFLKIDTAYKKNGAKAADKVLKEIKGEKFSLPTEKNPIIRTTRLPKGTIESETKVGQYDFDKLKETMFGDPNMPWTDAALYRSHLYPNYPSSWNPYTWLYNRKNKPTETKPTTKPTVQENKPSTTTTTAVEEAPVNTPKGNSGGGGAVAQSKELIPLSSPVIITGPNSEKIQSSIIGARKQLPFFNNSSSPIIVEPTITPPSRQITTKIIPESRRLPMGVIRMGYNPGIRAVNPNSARSYSTVAQAKGFHKRPGDFALTRDGEYIFRTKENASVWPVSNDYIWLDFDKQGGVLQKANRISKNAKGGIIKKFWIGGKNQINENRKEFAYDYSKRLKATPDNGYFVYYGDTTNEALDSLPDQNGLYGIEGKAKEGDFYNNIWIQQLKDNAELAKTYAEGFIKYYEAPNGNIKDKDWIKKRKPTYDKYMKLWFDEDGNFNHTKFINYLSNPKNGLQDGNGGRQHDIYGQIYYYKEDNPDEVSSGENDYDGYIWDGGEAKWDSELNMYKKKLIRSDNSNPNPENNPNNPDAQPDNKNPNSPNPDDNKPERKKVTNYIFDYYDENKNHFQQKLDDYDPNNLLPIYKHLQIIGRNKSTVGDTDFEDVYLKDPRTQITPSGDKEKNKNKPNSWYKWASLFASQALGAGDLASVIRSINKNEKTLKKGYRPIFHNPDYEKAWVYDPYNVYRYGENQSAENLSRINRMMTANQEDNVAAMSETIKGNREDKIKRDIQRDQVVAQGIDKSIQAANNNAKSAIKTANENFDRQYAWRQIEAQATADAEKSRQTAKSNYVGEIRKMMNQNITDYQAFQMNTIQKIAALEYQRKTSEAYAEWYAYYKEHSTEPDIYNSEAYRKYTAALEQAELEMYNYINERTSGLAGWPYQAYRNQFKYTNTPYT